MNTILCQHTCHWFINKHTLPQRSNPNQTALSFYDFLHLTTDKYAIPCCFIKTRKAVSRTVIDIKSRICSYPDIFPFFQKGTDEIITQRIFIIQSIPIHPVATTIITIQSITCANPQKAIAILNRTPSRIVRKSVFHLIPFKREISRSEYGFKIENDYTDKGCNLFFHINKK